jgi:hypothetical protein
MVSRVVIGALCGWMFLACGPATNAPTEFDDLVPVGGKVDTGYFSTLAVEMEGEFKSSLELDVSGLTDEDVSQLIGDFQLYPSQLERLIDLQVKLVKNQLNRHQLHVNITIDGVVIGDFDHDASAGLLKVPYTVPVETLVTHKELNEAGMSAESMVDKTYELKVAGDPRELYARVGSNCATGQGGYGLNDNNYFYYFDPDLPSCNVPMAAESVFKIRALLPFQDTYPEYDRLIEDGRIDAVIFFGAAEDNAVVSASDWGVMMWRTFEVNLRLMGFVKVDGLEVGQRYVRERAGLVEQVDLVSPYDLHDLGGAAFDMFATKLQTNEIIIYNGHSFYGSLNVLDAPENYPADTYQIVFMNSCWSYEYYTKQVFQAKSTEADTKGWALADVINNTTTARFSQMETSTRVILTNLLAGAESKGADEMGRKFSWQRIIGIINDEANGICPVDADPMDCRHYREQTNAEIYGVSGVRDNSFQP